MSPSRDENVLSANKTSRSSYKTSRKMVKKMKQSTKLIFVFSILITLFFMSNIESISGFDTFDPIVNITAPSDDDTVTGTITITATASDNIGVMCVEFKIGSTSIDIVFTAPYSVTVDLSDYISGDYQISAIAFDTAFNFAEDSITINILNYHDLTLPDDMDINGYCIDNSYGIGYHVDTIGSRQYGYHFMGYSDEIVQSSNGGFLTVKGYFRQYDKFSSSLQPNRRYLNIYILLTDQDTIVQKVKILNHDDGTNWCYKEVIISDLDPNTNYRFAFGRKDSWSHDWELTSEWAGVEVTSGFSYQSFDDCYALIVVAADYENRFLSGAVDFYDILIEYYDFDPTHIYFLSKCYTNDIPDEHIFASETDLDYGIQFLENHDIAGNQLIFRWFGHGKFEPIEGIIREDVSSKDEIQHWHFLTPYSPDYSPDSLTETVLQSKLSVLQSCKNLLLMLSPCASGGMIDYLQEDNRAILTSTHWLLNGNTNGEGSLWDLGVKYPHTEISSRLDADTNQDLLLSLYEIFWFSYDYVEENTLISMFDPFQNPQYWFGGDFNQFGYNLQIFNGVN